MIWLDGRTLFKCRDGGDLISVRIIDVALANGDVVIGWVSLSKRLIQVLSLFCLPDRKTSRRVSLFNLVIVLGLLSP